MHTVTRRFEDLHRRARVLRLEVAIEGIDEENHIAVAVPFVPEEIGTPLRERAPCGENPNELLSTEEARFDKGAMRAAQGA